MIGYVALGSFETELLLENALSKLELKPCLAPSEDVNLQQDLIYYLDGDIVVISTPLRVHNLGNFITRFNSYLTEQGINASNILAGIQGQGATEQHIVTACITIDKKEHLPEHQLLLIDPKLSNLDNFFANKGFNLKTLLGSLIKALNPFPRSSKIVAEENTTLNVDYLSLGTQSFFDKVSCGYHNARNLLTCLSLLQENQDITRRNLLTKTKNPVREVKAAAKEIDQDPNKRFAAIKHSHFMAFMKKAWVETFMPFASNAERESLHFGHYFMGWPRKNNASFKLLYFLSLSFITTPLINLIRRPVELFLNVMAEGSAYFKSRLISWAPKSFPAQYLRSGLLSLSYLAWGVFKGSYLCLSITTEAIVSLLTYKHASEQRKTVEPTGTIDRDPVTIRANNVSHHFKGKPVEDKKDEPEDSFYFVGEKTTQKVNKPEVKQEESFTLVSI